MKRFIKFATFVLMAVMVFILVSCDQEAKIEYVDKKADETAPANVTNLTASAKDGHVLLTWTNAADCDIYGYEVIYSGTSAINRVVLPAINAQSMMVSKDASGCYVSGLTNGTQYTFTVKSVDTSGNKSVGVQVSVTPVAGSSMAIELSVPPTPAHSVTVTANITTDSTVSRVVYKKNGSIIARTLLADSGAIDATEDITDNKKWTFTINATSESANGTYTVAAKDEAGREETAQITIDQFDFTSPANVTNLAAFYNSTVEKITLTWTDPAASDFDHVTMSYTVDGGSTVTQVGNVAKGAQTADITVGSTNATYYTFTVKSVDALGNTSSGVIINRSLGTVSDGFVAVNGATVSGAVNGSSVFMDGRTITIPNMLVCDHEVTQAEYQSTMGSNPSYFQGESYLPAEGETQAKRPVEQVSWYAAIAYCNKRSVMEGLTPCYTISGITNSDWATFTYSSVPTSSNNTWNAMTCDFTVNGYRLPTEAEWEYIARGGNSGIPATQTKYSGSDNILAVAWYQYNSDNKTHEVKKKNANTLGIYDMTGNVQEWCWDWYDDNIASTGVFSDSERVCRGSSWDTLVPSCTIVYRVFTHPLGYRENLGFRVVRTAQ